MIFHVNLIEGGVADGASQLPCGKSIVGVSATYSIASSTLWQPHLLYLIWDEDGSKKSLLKETMCNEVRLVLSMQLNTVLFSLHHTGIYLATGAVGIQRVKDGKSVIQTARCFTGCYTALHCYNHPGHMEVWAVCLWSSSLFGLPRGLWRRQFPIHSNPWGYPPKSSHFPYVLFFVFFHSKPSINWGTPMTTRKPVESSRSSVRTRIPARRDATLRRWYKAELKHVWRYRL